MYWMGRGVHILRREEAVSREDDVGIFPHAVAQPLKQSDVTLSFLNEKADMRNKAMPLLALSIVETR